MLYQIGPLTFRHAPLTLDRVSRLMSADFVEQPVIGVRPPLEHVGPGAETLTVSGELFPKHLGGMTEVEVLRGMVRSGAAQMVVRGDLVPLGWHRITEASVIESHLARDGVGQVQRFRIAMTRADRPGSTLIFAIIAAIFAVADR